MTRPSSRRIPPRGNRRFRCFTTILTITCTSATGAATSWTRSIARSPALRAAIPVTAVTRKAAAAVAADPFEGKAAPAFTVPDQDGKPVSLKDLRGKPVVLYFYPKDFTGGCTKEACDFRDNWRRVATTGAVVLGVSRDKVDLHKKFAAEYKLPYRLLADTDEVVCRKYDVMRQKSLYGRKYIGVDRSTFIIDPKGVVRKVFRSVKVEGHVDAVIEAVKAL